MVLAPRPDGRRGLQAAVAGGGGLQQSAQVAEMPLAPCLPGKCTGATPRSKSATLAACAIDPSPLALPAQTKQQNRTAVARLEA